MKVGWVVVRDGSGGLDRDRVMEAEYILRSLDRILYVQVSRAGL